MSSPRFPIPQGTLDMLILQILSLEPAHGYGIAQRLEQISQSVVQVNQGSLYPALHRLEQKGWLKAEWKQSETGREAKFYSLTASGRRQLAAVPSGVFQKSPWGEAWGDLPEDRFGPMTTCVPKPSRRQGRIYRASLVCGRRQASRIQPAAPSTPLGAQPLAQSLPPGAPESQPLPM